MSDGMSIFNEIKAGEKMSEDMQNRQTEALSPALTDRGNAIQSAGSFSWSSLGIGGPGIEVISSTAPMSSYSFSKFKMKMNDVARISFLNEEFFKVSAHWTKQSGYFLCTKKYCCEKLGNCTPARFAAILVYKNIDQKGNLVGNHLEWEIQIIKLGNKNFQALDLARMSTGRTSGYDLLVKCLDEKFQTYNFIAIPKTATWLGVESVVKEVQERLEYEGSHLLDCAGQRLSEERIKECVDKHLAELESQVSDGAQTNYWNRPKDDSSPQGGGEIIF